MSKYLVGLIALLLPLVSMASDLREGWPLKGENEDETQVIAAYKSQCAEWANQANESAETANAFQTQCVNEMKDIWPVGLDNSGDKESESE